MSRRRRSRNVQPYSGDYLGEQNHDCFILSVLQQAKTVGHKEGKSTCQNSPLVNVVYGECNGKEANRLQQLNTPRRGRTLNSSRKCRIRMDSPPVNGETIGGVGSGSSRIGDRKEMDSPNNVHLDLVSLLRSLERERIRDSAADMVLGRSPSRIHSARGMHSPRSVLHSPRSAMHSPRGVLHSPRGIDTMKNRRRTLPSSLSIEEGGNGHVSYIEKALGKSPHHCEYDSPPLSSSSELRSAMRQWRRRSAPVESLVWATPSPPPQPSESHGNEEHDDEDEPDDYEYRVDIAIPHRIANDDTLQLNDAFNSLTSALDELMVDKTMPSNGNIELRSPRRFAGSQSPIMSSTPRSTMASPRSNLHRLTPAEFSNPFQSSTRSPHSAASTPRSSRNSTPKQAQQDEDSIFERLHLNTPRRRSRQRKELTVDPLAEERELQECTFSPRIPERSRELSKDLPPLLDRTKEWQRAREERIQKKRDEIEEKLRNTNTFSPRISKRAQEFKSSVQSLMQWKQQREEQLETRREKMKEEALGKLTFSPRLSDRSLKLARRRKSREHTTATTAATTAAAAAAAGTVNNTPAAAKIKSPRDRGSKGNISARTKGSSTPRTPRSKSGKPVRTPRSARSSAKSQNRKSSNPAR